MEQTPDQKAEHERRQRVAAERNSKSHAPAPKPQPEIAPPVRAVEGPSTQKPAAKDKKDAPQPPRE